ncbi:MAG: hypothetical protein HY017_06275 [Betaproteobacteria bacterium]|nr:hypothetical protein [Betaproteobacteria bacterium]
MAAKNHNIDNIPVLITPHPVSDLTPEQLREMAAAAFPVIIEQLTGQGALATETRIDYVHPAMRDNKHCIDPNLSGPDK